MTNPPQAAAVATGATLRESGEEEKAVACIEGVKNGDDLFGTSRAPSPLPLSRLLYRPTDPVALSELFCLVRSQIEVFVATDDDVDDRTPRGGVRDFVDVGRVGLRCIHCARPREREQTDALQHPLKVRGAVSYPKTIRLIYQSVRNWQRHHLLVCPAMPQDIKARYLALKNGKGMEDNRERKRPAAGMKIIKTLYWEESCRKMGLIDTDEGIRLGSGGFTDCGDDTIGDSDLMTDDNSNHDALQSVENRRGMGAQATSAGNSSVCNGAVPVNLTSGSSLSIAPMPVPMRADQCNPVSSNAVVDSQYYDPPPLFTQETSLPNPGRNGGGADQLPVASVNTPTTLSSIRPSLALDGSPPSHSSSPFVDDGGMPLHPIHITAALPLSMGSAIASHSGSGALSRKAILDRAELAHNVVRAIMEMRELPPPTPFTDRGNGNGDSRSRGSKLTSPAAHEEDLRSLGMELYGLFADVDCAASETEVGMSEISLSAELLQNPSSSPSHQSEEGKLDKVDEQVYNSDGINVAGLLCQLINSAKDDSSREQRPQQKERKKRERFPSENGSLGFAQLRGLGLPLALCRLVSSLLKASTDTSNSGGGGHTCGSGYRSFEDVEEDLRIMIRHPDRFLFDPSTSASFAAAPGSCATRNQLQFSEIMTYGRDSEVAQIVEAFDRMVAPVSAGSCCDRKNEIVLISGYSGTGKSSIVLKARGHFMSAGASFISGKFDVMRQVQPLSAIVGALNEYCDLLAADKSRIKQVREAVSEAVGSGVQVLVGLIPGLGRIIPSSADKGISPQQVSGREALQRLVFLFRMLLRATCSPSNPIVLFLDDLQWADGISLELMSALITDSQIRGLLFVGCYRDNEVGPDHPLTVRLDEIQRSGNATITPINISNLERDSINALLSDVLHLMPSMTRPLAKAVQHKTGGNALFVVQFLVSLCDSGLLRYSLIMGRWEWDIDSIQARDIADNVVELMTAKLLCLPPEVHDALKVAAAFGAQCQESLLRILDRNPECSGSSAASLDVAVAEGLMVQVDDSSYRFSHDQIQSAAYLLISEPDREAFHLRIGQLLWKHSSTTELDSYLFVIVDQLHRGARLISDSDDKINLARLSFMAGQKAAAMSAFLPASVYLQAGIGALVENDWESHRELCLDLYNTCAEMEYVLGDFEEMKRHVEEVLRNARTMKEKLRAYYTLVQSMNAQGNARDAIDTTVTVLGYLGEHLPLSLTEAEVMQELMKTHCLLCERTEDALLHLATMEDAEKREAMRFLNSIAYASYTEKQDTFLLVICKMVRLSLSHGFCSESAIGFSYYGLILVGLLGDFAGGYRYGKLAISILEKFQAKNCFARVHGMVYGFINSWTEPLQSSFPPLKHAADVGLATGDTESAMICVHLYVGLALCSGHPLGPLFEEMKLYSKQMVECKQHYLWRLNAPLRQATLNLLGRSANPIKLIGEELDEDNLVGNVEEDGNDKYVSSTASFYRMWLEYLFGEYELAAETARKIQDLHKQVTGRFVLLCDYSLYKGLTALALARREGRTKYIDIIDKCISEMRTWALSTRWNCQHKLELLNAEYAYLEGDFVSAATTYGLAVDLATKHRFVHEQALSLERAGIFHMETGDHATACGFFARAHDCYNKWGACSKADHIQEHYLS